MTLRVTANIAAELVSHEGLVREAYRDSVGVWTWGIGVTSASGHKVYPRYKDNPQTLRRCFEVFEWVLRRKYLPAIAEVFAGHDLSEHELGAALSFHYNTGGLRRATWARQWREGQISKARASIMNWSHPPEIVSRRRKEQRLFFDGIWSNEGAASEFPVAKPSYKPRFSQAKRVQIRTVLRDLFP